VDEPRGRGARVVVLVIERASRCSAVWLWRGHWPRFRNNESAVRPISQRLSDKSGRSGALGSTKDTTSLACVSPAAILGWSCNPLAHRQALSIHFKEN
jgi:hypothetical protein